MKSLNRIIYGLLLILLGASISASVINIPKGRSDLLKSALLKAPAGSVVNLAGGEFVGNFEIKHPITLQSFDGAMLNAKHHSTILSVLAANVIIKNIHFKNSGTNITNKDSCVYLSSKAHHAIISDNAFDQCEFAVWIDGASNVLVKNNKIRGTAQKIISDRGNALHVFYTKNTVISDNRISLGRDGVYISNSTKVKILNNKMDHTRFGIHYMYSDNCTIRDNATTNSRIGAALMYSKQLYVKNNVFTYNDEHGLLLRNILNSKIDRNTSTNNADGIFIGGSYYNIIINNTFADNMLGAQITSGSTDNDVYDNNFINNRLAVKYLNVQSLVWGEHGKGNYWSSYVVSIVITTALVISLIMLLIYLIG